MAIKVYKRNTAARRNMSIIKPDQVTDKAPEKKLIVGLKKRAGRSNGKIAVRHKGGGHKRRYRKVDFKQQKFGVPGRIHAIERDPNRSALIALIYYKDGAKSYVLATEKMKVDQEIVSAENAPIEDGNRTKMGNIPTGTIVSNVELLAGKGGQLARSAGSGASVMSTDDDMTHLKLMSGEIRLISNECYATIGQVSKFEHNARRIGKAGRARHMGRRPAVRGSAMNPVDHPHGGGEGCQPIGLKYPKTPWGRPALGVRTRRKGKQSDQYVVKSRHNK